MIDVKEYMSKPIITVEQDSSVQEAVNLMDKHNIGSLLCMNGDEITGILTERDIVRRLLGKELSAEDTAIEKIMTKKVVTVQQDASLLEISSNMKKHVMRRIIVVDGDKPVGIVTSRDIIGLII